MAKHETPLLDQLESGPLPSFVTDIKRQAEKKPSVGIFLASWSYPIKIGLPTGSMVAS